MGFSINLFITNIEREKCDTVSIYELYRLRWQIELVFKTWKSVLKFDQFHPMNALRLECMILLKLIWVILNQTIFLFMQNFSDIELSFHKVAKTVSQYVRIEMIRIPIELEKWLTKTASKHLKKYKKEYKNGSKNNNLFNLTYCN